MNNLSSLLSRRCHQMPYSIMANEVIWIDTLTHSLLRTHALRLAFRPCLVRSLAISLPPFRSLSPTLSLFLFFSLSLFQSRYLFPPAAYFLSLHSPSLLPVFQLQELRRSSLGAAGGTGSVVIHQAQFLKSQRATEFAMRINYRANFL